MSRKAATDDFFNYTEKEALIGNVIEYLRKQNDSAEFITQFEQLYGKPQWQKTTAAEDDQQLYLFVPIAKRAHQEIETVWLFKITKNRIQYYPVPKSSVANDDLWVFHYLTQEVYGKPSVNGVRYVLGEKYPSSKGWVSVTIGVEGFIGVEYNGNYLEFSTGWHYWTTTVFTQYNPDDNQGGQYGYGPGTGSGEFNGGAGGGGGYNPPNNGTSLAPLAKKIFRNSSMTNQNWEALEKMLEKIINNCLGEGLYNGLMDALNGGTLIIQFNNTGTTSWFNHNTGTISLDMTGQSNRLFHEMWHAYQAYQETSETYSQFQMNREIETWYAQYLYLISLPEYQPGSEWHNHYNLSEVGVGIQYLKNYVSPNGNLLSDNTSLQSHLAGIDFLLRQIPNSSYPNYPPLDLDIPGIGNFKNLKTLSVNCN